MKVSTKAAADAVQLALREALTPVFEVPADLEFVKRAQEETLETFKRQGILSDYKTGTVAQLWATWKFKQKFKWWVYNRLPVIRNLSKEYRELTDNYNQAVALLDENNLNFDYNAEELPEHLIEDPKRIVVSDIVIKPYVAIDFITMNIEVSGEQ